MAQWSSVKQKYELQILFLLDDKRDVSKLLEDAEIPSMSSA